MMNMRNDKVKRIIAAVIVAVVVLAMVVPMALAYLV